ncbi:MAG TPA: glycerate kinase [Ramlibacter sp.]|nr:glycerate kinase [Ramlibacter sp.]
MNFQKFIVPVLGVVLVAAGWRAYGWGGVVAVVGGLVMWALLHVNRITRVLGRAADAPLGYVASAVMLNAKLKPGVNLLHVLAMTRSLGERLSEVDAEPEIFRWTDGGASSVTAEFTNGRLVKWTLVRPSEPPAAGAGS